MLFSLESAQSPTLCTALDTKTSTVGLSLPFSKIFLPLLSFEKNKDFCILVAKTFQEGEPQGIKSPHHLSHCNLESVSQTSMNTWQFYGTLLYILLFRAFLREYLGEEISIHIISPASSVNHMRSPKTGSLVCEYNRELLLMLSFPATA